MQGQSVAEGFAERGVDRKLNGLYYFASIAILARCDHLIAGKTMATQFIRTMAIRRLRRSSIGISDATAWTTRESAAGKRQVKPFYAKPTAQKWRINKGDARQTERPLMILQRFFHGHGGGASPGFGKAQPSVQRASEAALSGAICTAQTAKPRAFMAAKSSGSADEATPRLRIAPETAMP